MGADAAPLQMNVPIVDNKGMPSSYFIKWARQFSDNSAGQGDLAGFASQTRTITAGLGLTGGGDLSANRTLAVDPEYVRDTIAAFIKAGSNVTVTHDDAANTLTIDSTGGGGAGGGGIYPTLTAPVNGSLTWFNQGTATSTVNSNGSISIRVPNTAGSGFRGRMVAVPAGPYTLTVGFVSSARFSVSGFQAAGILMQNTSTGQLKTFGLAADNTTFQSYFAQNWSNATTYNSNTIAATNVFEGSGLQFMRVKDDGTNLIYSVSNDGFEFITLATVPRTSYTVPNMIGFMVNEASGQRPLTVSLHHFSLTTP